MTPCSTNGNTRQKHLMWMPESLWCPSTPASRPELLNPHLQAVAVVNQAGHLLTIFCVVSLWRLPMFR